MIRFLTKLIKLVVSLFSIQAFCLSKVCLKMGFQKNEIQDCESKKCNLFQGGNLHRQKLLWFLNLSAKVYLHKVFQNCPSAKVYVHKIFQS